MKKLLLLLVCLVGLFLDGHADAYRTARVGVREGLTNVNVKDIEQDGDGLIWIGTEEGLFQLTGDRCIHYDKRLLGLDGCNVSSLCYQSSDNMLWVATLQSGLTRYDCVRREFLPLTQADGLLSQMITGVANAADGGVWIFHHRGMIQHWKAGVFTTLLTTGLPDVIRSGMDDGRGHLYVGHRSHGVSRIDLATGHITENVEIRYLPQSTPGKDVYCLRVEPDGGIAGGSLAALSMIDREGNEWSRLEGRGLMVRYKTPLFFRVSPMEDAAESQAPVSCMTQDSDGNIWLGSDRGLMRINDEAVILDTLNILSRCALEDAVIKTLHFDHRGHLLVGLLSHSLLDYDVSTGQCTHIQIAERGIDVHDFAEDASHRLWMATEMGVYSRSAGGTFLRDTLRNSLLHSQIVRSLSFDADGNMWIGTIGDGVTVVSPRGELVARLRTDEGLLSDNVSAILCDAASREVWIGTQGGLVHVFDSRRPDAFQILDQQQGLASNRIESLQKDRFGQLWVSTQIGVSSWDSVHRRFINYSYEDGIPEGMYFEGSSLSLADGSLLFGSYTGCAVVHPEEGGGARRVRVSLFPLHHQPVWYLTLPMILLYLAFLLVGAYILLYRFYRHKSHEALQTERLLQYVAPVPVEMSQSDRQFIDRLTTYIEENLQSESLDVASIAQEMAMSHSAFYRKVKSLTGCTAAEFIRKVKLRKSRQLLEIGGHTISEVAQLTGFNNLGNFRQAFKKEFGMLPSASCKAKESV